MSEKDVILKSFISFSNFLSHALGQQSFIEIYALEEDGESGEVIYVSPNASNKELGVPITPFFKSIARSFQKTQCKELFHVDTEASTTSGRVKLNIFPICTSDGTMIGIFVLRFNVELAFEIRTLVNQLLGFTDPKDTSFKITNIIDQELSLTNYMQKLIRDEINACGIPVSRMTIEEKRKIIVKLEKMEVFFVRDSVRVVAEILGISIPTVYRLLRQAN